MSGRVLAAVRRSPWITGPLTVFSAALNLLGLLDVSWDVVVFILAVAFVGGVRIAVQDLTNENRGLREDNRPLLRAQLFRRRRPDSRRDDLSMRIVNEGRHPLLDIEWNLSSWHQVSDLPVPVPRLDSGDFVAVTIFIGVRDRGTTAEIELKAKLPDGSSYERTQLLTEAGAGAFE